MFPFLCDTAEDMLAPLLTSLPWMKVCKNIRPLFKCACSFKPYSLCSQDEFGQFYYGSVLWNLIWENKVQDSKTPWIRLQSQKGAYAFLPLQRLSSSLLCTSFSTFTLNFVRTILRGKSSLCSFSKLKHDEIEVKVINFSLKNFILQSILSILIMDIKIFCDSLSCYNGFFSILYNSHNILQN